MKTNQAFEVCVKISIGFLLAGLAFVICCAVCNFQHIGIFGGWAQEFKITTLLMAIGVIFFLISIVLYVRSNTKIEPEQKQKLKPISLPTPPPSAPPQTTGIPTIPVPPSNSPGEESVPIARFVPDEDELENKTYQLH